MNEELIPILVGGVGEKKSNGGTQYYQQDRIYSADTVAMAHCSNIPGGSYKYDVSALRMVRTEEGKQKRKQYENHEIHHGFNEMRKAEPRTDGVTNSLTTVLKDNLIQTCSIRTRHYIGQDAKLETGGDIGNAITTVQKDSMVKEMEEKRIRIRKLTPKECYRLMGFDDKAFESASGVNSNSQLYKQAGNGIVVNCLVAMFGQLYEGKEDVYKRVTTDNENGIYYR